MTKPEFCRTCFGSTNLMPIFSELSDHDKCTNDLFLITGIKIEKGDTLSQLICTECSDFIQASLNFRKKCEETDRKLLKLFKDPDQKPKYVSMETEQKVEIEIELCADSKKYLDNDYVVSECSFNDFLKKDAEIVFTNRKKQRKTDLSFIKLDKYTEEEESLQCQLCSKVCRSIRALKYHKRAHSMVKPICQYCGKALKDEKALLVHYKAMHGHEKTDKCRFCDYRGSRPELVKIHERTHTGEKPYVCAECGAGFHRKSSYLTHTPLHLPDKTVQCDECPAMFKSVTLMHIHKSNTHRRRRKQASGAGNIWTQ